LQTQFDEKFCRYCFWILTLWENNFEQIFWAREVLDFLKCFACGKVFE